MTPVSTGTFGLNGTEFIIQPSEGKWVPRNTLGIDGAGHPIYPAVREFEMSWDIFDQATWNQIQNYYNAVGNTGTVVANLPPYGGPNFVFQPYSGCTLGEPEVNGAFITHEGYLRSIKLVIMNIRTV